MSGLWMKAFLEKHFAWLDLVDYMYRLFEHSLVLLWMKFIGFTGRVSLDLFSKILELGEKKDSVSSWFLNDFGGYCLGLIWLAMEELTKRLEELEKRVQHLEAVLRYQARKNKWALLAFTQCLANWIVVYFLWLPSNPELQGFSIRLTVRQYSMQSKPLQLLLPISHSF